jgi:superfamily II DNA or RNA helicase
LHDVTGLRPRVSLISPTFNAKSHIQVLGRIHRNGSKSDALQQIVVAADTVEESVMNAINRKCKNLRDLHGFEFSLDEQTLLV